MVVESELSFYQGVAATGRCRRHALFLSRRVAPTRRPVPALRGAARWRRRAPPAPERGHGCLSWGAAAMTGAEGGSSAERRGGEECVRPGRPGWSPCHDKIKKNYT